MTDSPQVPSTAFIFTAKLRVHMEEGWAKREWIESLNQLEPREREIELLVSRGVQREKAEVMATELKRNKGDLEKIKREQAKLQAMKDVDRMRGRVRGAKKVAKKKKIHLEDFENVNDDNQLSEKFPSWND